MRRFKPLHGILIVLAVMGAVWGAQAALDSRLNPSGFIQISPDRQGVVKIGLADLKPREVRFYRFLNSGNQEVHFLVGRDSAGRRAGRLRRQRDLRQARAGLPARGRLAGVQQVRQVASAWREVNAGGGGCKPVPLKHRIEGDQLVLAEADILQGWRLFR